VLASRDVSGAPQEIARTDTIATEALATREDGIE
jgi:hypothetical protein